MTKPINPKIYLILALALGWMYILYEYAVRVSESVIIQPLMHTLNIGATQIGILSSAYYIPYIVMQIPAGMLMDRFGVAKTWLMALLSVALGCYLFSISQTLEIAFLGRVLMGVGSAFAWVGVVNIICAAFNKKHHAFLIGVSMTLCMLGAVLGQEPWLWLTNQLGSWERPYFIAAFIGLGLAVFILLMRKQMTIQPLQSGRNISGVFASLKPLIKSKKFWVLALYITAISLPQNAFTALWAVEFFKQTYHFKADVAATLVSLVWFGGILGAPLIGLWSGRKSNQKALLLLFNGVTLLLTLLLIFVTMHSFLFVAALLLLMGFVTNASVIIYAEVAKLGGEDEVSSTAVSAVNMLNMAGAALVQVLMGYILQLTNVSSSHLTHFALALSIMPVSLVVSMICLRWFNERA